MIKCPRKPKEVSKSPEARILLNLPRPEGHLITNQPMLLLCNIIVTETIGTLLGDLTVA